MSDESALRSFRLESAAIDHIGHGLQRPESVKTTRDGAVWCCDARGIVRIHPDGRQDLIGDPDYRGFVDASDDHMRFTRGSLPNGFGWDPKTGDVLCANLGLGRFERRGMDGSVAVLLDQIDGAPIGRPNFLMVDAQDRLWMTVSTRQDDWTELMLHPELATDGYVILMDEKGPRIVADGLRFANECRISPDGRFLYVAESVGQRIVRFAIQADGGLGEKELFGPAELPGVPDGIAFDSEGNLWVTLPINEEILVLFPDGSTHCIASFPQPDAIARHVEAVTAGRFDVSLALAAGSPEFNVISSIAFGGADLRTVYTGSLAGTGIARFRSPVAGLPARHW